MKVSGKIGMAIGSVIATGAMTLFSYWYSRRYQKQFREPRLLARNLSNNGNVAPGQMKIIAGWIIHFGVGVLFTALYWKIWNNKRKMPGIPEGIITGILSGIFAVQVWKYTFKIHPNPPRIDYQGFYRHLVLAHVVLVLSDVMVYRIQRHLAVIGNGEAQIEGKVLLIKRAPKRNADGVKHLRIKALPE